MSKPFKEGVFPADSSVLRPFIVGITGGRGTGKSETGDILVKRHGAHVIDSDHMTHWLLDNPGPAYDEVLARFGADLAPSAGAPINREVLSERAFATAEAKTALEAIMVPRINERLEVLILALASAGVRVVHIQSPLMHEAKLRPHFDLVWCVVANEEIRIQRVMERDEVDEAEAKRLCSLQFSQTEKARLSDFLIDNSGDLENTAVQIEKLQADALERAAKFFGVDKVVQPSSTPSEAEPQGEPKTDEAVENPGKSGGEDPASEAANQRLRQLMRELSSLGTEDILGRLANVAGTGHQEATSRLTLVVDRETDGSPDHSREIEVEVKMTARNKTGAPPDPNRCSCGCGTNCRVSCTCAADCGCTCKKPTPPPPGPGGDHCHHKHGPSRLWLLVLALFGLFAFLAFLYAWNHPTPKPESNKVTVINNLPPCNDCKPKDPDTPVPPVVEPPVTPPTNPPKDPCPAGQTQELDEAPGFAFRFLHNAVRVKVARWEVVYGAGCKGANVTGFDADKRLLVYQEYDEHYWMTFQWVVSYFPDSSAQIDRFEGRGNIFMGRTLYRFNQYGQVIKAEYYNGDKRLVHIATFVRNARGEVSGLGVEEFDPTSGVPKVKRTIDGVDSAKEYMTTKFYIYGWFAP